ITATGAWQRMSIAFTPTATTMRIVIRQYSGGTGVIAMTGVQVTQGTTLYNYSDGDSPGWIWNSTANNSTSTGPSL
ncbi:MAG: hypothetical protein WAQ27_01540, partial [Candidatus Microsaccharimonas sp.]